MKKGNVWFGGECGAELSSVLSLICFWILDAVEIAGSLLQDHPPASKTPPPPPPSTGQAPFNGMMPVVSLHQTGVLLRPSSPLVTYPHKRLYVSSCRGEAAALAPRTRSLLLVCLSAWAGGTFTPPTRFSYSAGGSEPDLLWVLVYFWSTTSSAVPGFFFWIFFFF